jgi:hypothetical protein
MSRLIYSPDDLQREALMRSRHWFFAAVAALTLSGAAGAETLNTPSTPSAGGDRPSRGMSMEKVEAAFGAPANRVAPIGDPPITRWEYPGFVVYFEHQLVVHTVARG